MLQALTASVIKAGDGFVFLGDDTRIFSDDESINVDLPNGAQDINAIVNLYGDLFHVFCMRTVAIRATLERAGVASAYLSLFNNLCEMDLEIYILCVTDIEANMFKLLIPLPSGEAITELNLQEWTDCAPTVIALHVACSKDWYESEFVEATSDSFAHHILTSPSQ